MATLLPLPKARFFNASGSAPLAGGKVYTYIAGTTTPKATYTDASGATPNANPVILDAAGEANIWLDGNYKIILTNSADVQQWSVDNVSGLPSDLPQWLTVTGTDTIIATPTTAIPGYVANQTFLFVAAGTNTTAVTINISGLGTKNITKDGSTALVAGDIVSGMVCQISYDGTRFQLVNPSMLTPTFPGTVTMSGAAINEAVYVDIAAASTVNVYAAASNNVRITGSGANISSFGTAAAGITRRVRFAGVNTLVYNATSQIQQTLANITTATDDEVNITSLGAGNSYLWGYSRADGTPLYSSGRLLNVRYFTTPGSSTYTPTAGTNAVFVKCQGGGGGGSRRDDASNGSGGGGGGYSEKWITSAFSGVTITVGAAGTGATSATSGGNGGTSSFGAILSSTGGTGGATATETSSAGGAGSGGDFNATGGSGFSLGGAVASGTGAGSSVYCGADNIKVGNSSAAQAARGFGCGGGAGSGTNNGANGGTGVVEVWEYS